jgi:hypothetical protein
LLKLRLLTSELVSERSKQSLQKPLALFLADASFRRAMILTLWRSFAETSAQMRFIQSIRSRSMQQRNVAVLVFALVVWMWALAAHIHTTDEHSSAAASHACSFCLMPSAAAPPPAPIKISQSVQILVGVVAECIDALATSPFPASYLSRGPPVR